MNAIDLLAATFPDVQEQSLLSSLAQGEGVRSVYADWLEERGDSRGTFLRAQIAIREGMRVAENVRKLEELRPSIHPYWLAAIGDTATRFGPIHSEMVASEAPRGWNPWLKAQTMGCLLDIHYHGDLLSDPFDETLALMASPDVAPALRSVLLDGHEDRSRTNGTLGINLTRLTEADTVFDNLSSLATEQGSGVIIEGNVSYEEAGMLGRLLRKCPRLDRLAVPSSPDHTFFEVPPHPLRYLNVAVGYDAQNFLHNLGQSACFPNLEHLVFHEYAEDYMEDFAERCSRFADFEELLCSPAMKSVTTIELREVMLTRAEINALERIRSGVIISERLM